MSNSEIVKPVTCPLSSYVWLKASVENSVKNFIDLLEWLGDMFGLGL